MNLSSIALLIQLVAQLLSNNPTPATLQLSVNALNVAAQALQSSQLPSGGPTEVSPQIETQPAVVNPPSGEIGTAASTSTVPDFCPPQKNIDNWNSAVSLWNNDRSAVPYPPFYWLNQQIDNSSSFGLTFDQRSQCGMDHINGGY